MLSFGQDAKNSQLSALLWHRNTSEHFDTRGATNLGYTKRKALAAESKEMDMMHLDLFFQNRYLLNGVEVRLRLIRSNDLFCLHGNANQADNKVSLKEMTLFVRKVKPNPAFLRTACSCQSLATRHCKIPTSTCGSQELYCADRESKHHQRKFIFGSIAHTNSVRCSGQ